MSQQPDLCIIGAGPAGAILAAVAARRGMSVVLVEAGPRFDRTKRPEQLFRWQVMGTNPWPWERADRDGFVDSSDQRYPLNGTRVKGVGGSSLHWGGVAQRLHESDFHTASLYGLGIDWPLSYDELEPYYGQAELEIGVAGEANPGLPYRSTPFPLPAYPDGYTDGVWRTAASKLGIQVGSISVAKNSVAYAGRPQCQTFSVCSICPIGAQYSADVHVAEAESSGRCEVLTETVARRIETDGAGRATSVHVASLDGRQWEIQASKFVVAAHSIESARLLLLSGIGNRSDQLGRNLMEHWYVGARGFRDDRGYPGRIGFHTLESQHFYDHPDRQSSGAIKLEFSDGGEPLAALREQNLWGTALAEYDRQQFGHWLTITAETEQQPNPESRVTLDTSVRDMFGDPVPHIRFKLSETDNRTRSKAFDYVSTVLEATGVRDIVKFNNLSPAAHHLGTCRMSQDPDLGVVDRNLRVHGTDNLFVVGASVFPTGGAVQPTLTIAALALRLADHLSPSL